MQSYQQPDRKSRTTEVLHTERTKLPLKYQPVDLIGQHVERMFPIQNLV